jgi:AcrR family transcriptional regulator
VGRPREFDEAAVVAAARDAFWAAGFAGTSLDELTTATGLGKGSLYGAFGSKRELFVRVFDEYCTEATSAMGRALDGPDETAMGRLAAYVRRIAELTAVDAERRGCLLAKGSTELAGRDPAIAERAAAAVATMETHVAGVLDQARRQGHLTDAADVTALARTVLAALRGIEALGKAGASREVLCDIADTTMVLLSPSHRISPSAQRPRDPGTTAP